jgi:preprotein translocase subunit YajC
MAGNLPSQRMKEMKNFRQALEKGSKVVTTGGIHGKVVELRENNTVLVDSGGTKIIVDRESLNPGFEPAPK